MPARIASIIAAGFIGLFSLGLFAAGGLLLWGDAQKDEHGYISTARERVATNTHALATENLDIEADGLEWIVDRERYGKIRLEVEARSGERLFAGIARTSEVTDYLRGANHDVITDISYSPFNADYREQVGDRRPAAPAKQPFWAASTQGTGTQALTWDVEGGDWSIVVMNADASRGVDAKVKAGAEVPFFPAVGWGAVIAGLVLLVLASLLAVLGIRPRRRVAVAA
jgi:molybdopterin converting factor small subunit